MQIINDRISLDYLYYLIDEKNELIALFHARWSDFSNELKDEFLEKKPDQYKESNKIIIDVDKNRELMKKLGINQIPSLVSITRAKVKILK